MKRFSLLSRPGETGAVQSWKVLPAGSKGTPLIRGLMSLGLEN